jgi:hypothetical protein
LSQSWNSYCWLVLDLLCFPFFSCFVYLLGSNFSNQWEFAHEGYTLKILS